jgi:hypothetical protein
MEGERPRSAGYLGRRSAPNPYPWSPGQKVVARRADQPVRLVRFPGQTFFQTLRRKLKWGDLAERE